MKNYYDNIKPPLPLVGTGDIQPVTVGASGEAVGQAAPRRKKREGAKWADFSYWFNLIDKNKKDLKPKERIELARWALEYIAENMGKPKAPEAKTDPAKLLAELEAGNKR